MTYNNISQFEYDAWKLSNPDDDGYYTEDTKPRIQGSMYFKYKHKHSAKYCYAMITTSGHYIRIWNYGDIRNVDVDDIETYVEDVNGEIDRVNTHFESFQFIEVEEFMEEFDEAHTKILKLVQREAKY